METTFLVTQKPTAKKGATTVVDVQQTNRTMGAIKERMKTTDTSKTTDWEKKLYANGDVFSKDFVDSSKLTISNPYSMFFSTCTHIYTVLKL